MEDEPVSILFIQAIKNQESIELLESLRSEPCFYWEPDPEYWRHSAAFALVYAIECRHEAYARYLLTNFPEESMKSPGVKDEVQQRYARHLGLAVTCDQPEILKIILETAQKLLLKSYVNLEHRLFPWDGSTALHLACERLRGDMILILLCNGATGMPNNRGETPIDVILYKISSSDKNMRLKMKCLDHLLLFAPLTIVMRQSLKENPQGWKAILGEEVYAYLLGKRPAPLAFMSMKRILQQLPPSNPMRSLQELHIPHIVRNSFSLVY